MFRTKGREWNSYLKGSNEYLSSTEGSYSKDAFIHSRRVVYCDGSMCNVLGGVI